MNEKTIQIDPRLAGVRVSVAFGLYEKLVEPLLTQKLLIDVDERPTLPFTQNGLEVLMKALVSGITLALSRAEVNIPEGYAPDEITLTENMLGAFGVATLGVAENQLSLNFAGEGALIKSIVTPLDVDRALAEKPEGDGSIVDVQIGKRPKIVGDGFIDLTKPDLGLLSSSRRILL